MCHKCNRYGHFARECPNFVCFNCDNLGHTSKECPDSPRCCICKSLNHLAINCEYSWGSSVINFAGASSCDNSSITDTKSNATATQMDVEDSSNVSAPAASDAVVLVLLSRNNQSLYCHLNLLPCLHPLRPRLQLRLLVLLLLPTVMFYSLPCHFRPNPRLHLLPVHRQRRPQGSIEPNLIARLIPCVGLLMFQFCFVLLKHYRRAGLLRFMDLRPSVSAVSQARHTLLGQGNIY